MRLLTACVLCLLATICYSQKDLKIGYQQFPTTITGHASDIQGNMYYTGTFKGELKVNETVLSSGEGLEDIFWVKTSSGGQILQYKTFGSPFYDYAINDGLAIGANGQMFMLSAFSGDVQFGNIQVDAYQYLSGNKSMQTLACLDTAGNVKWVRRLNVGLLGVTCKQNIVHVLASIGELSAATKVDNVAVSDSVGKRGMIHLMFDTSGNFLGKKLITTTSNSHMLSFQGIGGYSDGSVMLSFQLQGGTGFVVNNSTVTMPSTNGQYHILLKADTAYKNVKTKVINPGLQQVYGSGTGTLTAVLSSNDSLYTVLSPVTGSPYSIDGYSILPNQNMLVVFDNTLTAKRSASLGSSFVASHPVSIAKRRIFFRSIENIDDNLYLTGQFVGVNESTTSAVSSKDTLVPIIANSLGTVDLNGPSKSFVAKISLGISNSSMQWIGDHKLYEYANMYPFVWHRANADHFVFLMNRDNSWNPWIIDTNLNIISGAMKRNADRAETPRMVSFFPDGSKLTVSYASGNTAFDTTTKVISNFIRRDVFFAHFNADGSLRWQKRVQSTLFQPTTRNMVVKNNKAWFLAQYVGSQNETNSITIDGEVYNVNVNASLLCSIDANGTMVPLNLKNNIYKDGLIQDFSFFSNGDIALLVSTNYPIGVTGFPPAQGYFILRVDPVTGALLETRKFISDNLIPAAVAIEITGDDVIYVSWVATSNSSVSSSKLFLYSSEGVLDFINYTNDVNGNLNTSLLKMGWKKLEWMKKFNGTAGSTNIGINNLFLFNDLPVLAVRPSRQNQALYWENQFLNNSPNTLHPTIVTLDESGNLLQSKYLPFPINFIRKGSKNQLYISGYIVVNTQLDTFNINHLGRNDAVAAVVDSVLTIRNIFQFASPHNEIMYDVDILKDSVVAFAYGAQAVPGLYAYRTTVQTSDFDTEAFISTTLLKQSNSLPVHWLTFDAYKQGETVRLRWNVLNNSENDRFEVEHRFGSSSYKKIATESSEPGKTFYELHHSTPSLIETNYYRIKQIDKDGKTSYSVVRSASFYQHVFKFSPNPATSVLRVSTNQLVVTVSVYEATGKKVMMNLLSGDNKEFSISHLPKGMYVLVAESNGEIINKSKFVKQ